MFFKKKITDAPSIENEQQYIAWFIEHSEKVADIRKLYKKNIDKFIITCTKGATKVLDEYPNDDALFDRVGELSEVYETQMKPLVENRGGLKYCPPELQSAVAILLINIFVCLEFLEKKYKHKEAIELFSSIR
jgi:hypothetical protein